jgi:hypothetical protein
MSHKDLLAVAKTGFAANATATRNSPYITAYRYTGTGGHVLTLPAVAGYSEGGLFSVKHRGTGTLTVQRAGADTIDGANTVDLVTGQAITLAYGAAGEWDIL